MINKEYFENNIIKNNTGFSIEFAYIIEEDCIAYVYSYKGKEINWFKSFNDVPETFKKSLIDYHYEYTYYNTYDKKDVKDSKPSIMFEKNDIVITTKNGEELLIVCETVGEEGTKFELFVDGINVKETYNLELMIDYING